MGPMQRYLMFFSYKGTSFWGSQLQIYEGCSHTRETVQYVLENGLNQIFRLKDERPIRVQMASRTDKGVHALRAALHVDLPQYKGKFLKPNSIKYHLNYQFKDFRDVRILEVYTVPDSFNIRTAVLGKTYLFRCGLMKREFLEGSKTNFCHPIMEVSNTHLIGSPLNFDLKKVEEATALFKGEKDFGAVVGCPKRNTRPTVCNITSFTVEEAQPLVPFDHMAQKYNYYNFICKGNRFLYHMVRRMVTLALSVGFNILTLDDIQKLFDKPVPSSWPKCVFRMVPGTGLYLVDTNIDQQKINQIEDIVTENKTDEIIQTAES